MRKYSLDINTVRSLGVIPQTFTRGMLPQEMEEVVFVDNPDPYCPPVKTEIGYHIIKIIENHPFEKSDYKTTRDQLAGQLRQRKVKLRFNLYVKSLREKYHYEVIDSATALVADKFQGYSGKSKLSANKLSPQELELQVVKFGGSGLTADKLIAKLNQSPQHLRANIKTSEGISEFLHQTTQTDLLYLDALERGLDNDPAYQQKLAYKTSSLIQQECQRKLVFTKVSVSEQELKDYYNLHKSTFGKRPFEEVRTFVRNELHNQKQKELMAEVVAELKDRFNIKYNEQILDDVVAELNKLKQA